MKKWWHYFVDVICCWKRNQFNCWKQKNIQNVRRSFVSFFFFNIFHMYVVCMQMILAFVRLFPFNSHSNRPNTNFPNVRFHFYQQPKSKWQWEFDTSSIHFYQLNTSVLHTKLNTPIQRSRVPVVFPTQIYWRCIDTNKKYKTTKKLYNDFLVEHLNLEQMQMAANTKSMNAEYYTTPSVLASTCYFQPAFYFTFWTYWIVVLSTDSWLRVTIKFDDKKLKDVKVETKQNRLTALLNISSIRTFVLENCMWCDRSWSVLRFTHFILVSFYLLCGMNLIKS